MSKKLKSIKGMEDVVNNTIQKEIEGRHISGPHKFLPLLNLCVSALGFVLGNLGSFIAFHVLKGVQSTVLLGCHEMTS